MNLFKGFLRTLHDHNSDVRQHRNIAALAPLGDGEANSKHITSRKEAKAEATRLIHIALRRMKVDRQRCETAIEMYLDDWAFHNGPITKANITEAMGDCVERVRQRTQAARRVAEQAEDYDGMKDFPF